SSGWHLASDPAGAGPSGIEGSGSLQTLPGSKNPTIGDATLRQRQSRCAGGQGPRTSRRAYRIGPAFSITRDDPREIACEPHAAFLLAERNSQLPRLDYGPR